MKTLRLPALAAAVVVALALPLAPSPALAQKVLKLSHLNPADPLDNATGAMAAVFKNLVESGTNGSVKVDLYADGRLGKDPEVLQQVKAGVVQSLIATVGGMATVYPMIGVLDVPFAFPNISTTYDVLDGPFGKKMAADMEKKTGMKVLGFGDSGGFFAMTNSKRPIKEPKDLAGLKIRTMTLESHKAIISSLGGQPVAIAWPEVYTSLQTGVADGQMNPIPIVKFAKFEEVQKYLSLTNHLFTPYVWVMNKAFFDGLTDEQKSVVASAARSAIVAGRGLSRIVEASERGLPALAAKMEVYTPTAAEKKQFRDLTQPAVKAYITKTFGADGEDMLNAFLAAVDEAAKNY